MREHLTLAVVVAALLACGASGPRVVGAEGVTAKDALLADHEGTELALASTWQDHYSIIVFYRGHW